MPLSSLLIAPPDGKPGLPTIGKVVAPVSRSIGKQVP